MIEISIISHPNASDTTSTFALYLLDNGSFAYQESGYCNCCGPSTPSTDDLEPVDLHNIGAFIMTARRWARDMADSVDKRVSLLGRVQAMVDTLLDRLDEGYEAKVEAAADKVKGLRAKSIKLTEQRKAMIEKMDHGISEVLRDLAVAQEEYNKLIG